MYESMHDGETKQFLVRPIKEFTEEVNVVEKMTPRLTLETPDK